MEEKKDNKKIYNGMSELLRSKRLFWIFSLPTLKRWVHRDMKRRNILRTKIEKNKGRGARYYWLKEDVEDYVNAFHRGELDLGDRYEQ